MKTPHARLGASETRQVGRKLYAQMGALKELGRIGLRAIVYFEVVSGLALAIGLVVVTVVEPGTGVNADRSTLDATTVASYATAAKSLTATDFVLNIIPTTFVDAFSKGEILQVLDVNRATCVLDGKAPDAGESVEAELGTVAFQR